MVDLVGVGLNATDTLIHVSSFPLSGSKVEYEAETIMPGGQVATTVIACQKMRAALADVAFPLHYRQELDRADALVAHLLLKLGKVYSASGWHFLFIYRERW